MITRFYEYWLEPVVEIDGEWSLTEENDGFQTDYGVWAVEDYFDQNSIEPVGYFYEQHDDNGTDHGYETTTDQTMDTMMTTELIMEMTVTSQTMDITTKICLMIMASQCFT